jgi:hypothetical protein
MSSCRSSAATRAEPRRAAGIALLALALPRETGSGSGPGARDWAQAATPIRRLRATAAARRADGSGSGPAPTLGFWSASSRSSSSVHGLLDPGSNACARAIACIRMHRCRIEP